MDDQQNAPQTPIVPNEPQVFQPAESSAPIPENSQPTTLAPTPQPVVTVQQTAEAAQVNSNNFSSPQGSTLPSTGSPSGAGKKILLVEDDDALANVYQTRLESEGFQTQRVANGEEALQSALQYKPDLIVLDVMMPKVSGFDVLDILRNTPDTSGVKIVMLTALSQDADKERAKSLGVNEYLVKSQVVIADVVERIKHQLGIA
ncbi:MAG: response regulator [Patescibacteria group bacterium]